MRPFLYSALSIAFTALLTPSLALAAGVQILNVYPLGVIAPGTTVMFSVAPSGFVDPSYSLSDSLSASGGTAGTIDKAGSYTWTPNVYDAGLHTITVSASDSLGNKATASVNIKVASTVVFVSAVTPGPVVSYGRSYSFTLTAPGFTSPSYAVYDSLYSSSITPANISGSTFSWTPTMGDVGTHTLTVHASDAYGNSAQAQVTATVIDPALSLSTHPSSVGVGSALSFKVSGMLGTTTTYSTSDSFIGASTLASNALATSGTFSWKPAVADIGMHTITIIGTDAYGNTASTTTMVLVTQATNTSNTSATTPAPSTPATTSALPSTASAAAKFTFTKTLTIGSKGTEVTELQKRLVTLGYLKAVATGQYGSLTSAAVKKFQAAKKILQTGSVGPATRAALNSGS
jgi:hypothetical protein